VSSHIIVYLLRNYHIVIMVNITITVTMKYYSTSFVTEIIEKDSINKQAKPNKHRRTTKLQVIHIYSINCQTNGI